METMNRILPTDTIRILKDAVTYELMLEEEGGYVVTVIDYPSCLSQGETLDEALANAEDALYGCLLVDQEAGFDLPEHLETFLHRIGERTDEQNQSPTAQRAYSHP
jgi:predicted RNase H-like HicB family nuclease